MADNFLTETAFVVPGTKARVPRWAVLAVLAGVVVILLLRQQAGPGAAPEDESFAEEESEGGIGSLIDELAELTSQINVPQGLEDFSQMSVDYDYSETPTPPPTWYPPEEPKSILKSAPKTIEKAPAQTDSLLVKSAAKTTLQKDGVSSTIVNQASKPVIQQSDTKTYGKIATPTVRYTG